MLTPIDIMFPSSFAYASKKINYKIPKATFRTSQCQDGDEVLKFYE